MTQRPAKRQVTRAFKLAEKAVAAGDNAKAVRIMREVGGHDAGADMAKFLRTCHEVAKRGDQ